MVDAIDSKSIALCGCVSSSLTGGTTKKTLSSTYSSSFEILFFNPKILLTPPSLLYFQGF